MKISSGASRRRVLIAVSVLLTLPGLTGCQQEEPQPTAAGACDLVVDVTGHPGAEWSTAMIRSGADQLQEDCKDRQLTAHLITDYSKANQCPQPDVLANPGELGQSTKEERLRGEAWAEFGQQLEAMINCGVYGPDADPTVAPKLKLEGTDVFSAVQATAEVLGKTPEPRTVYFVSDMRNTMPPMKTPPKKKVTAAVKELKKSGELPDLAGADVVVVGSGSSNKLTPEENAKLVDFWEAYFEAANAGSVSFRQSIG